MLKCGESSPDLLKLGQTPVSLTLTQPNLIRFWPNLGQISIDTKEYQPNLVRSNQIWQDPTRFRPKSDKITKPETDRLLPETRYDLTRLIWNFPQVGCGSKFSPPEKVDSSPSWAQTRPGPTLGHPQNNSWLPFIFYVQIFFLKDTIVKLLQKRILTKIKKYLTLLYNVEDNFFYAIS